MTLAGESFDNVGVTETASVTFNTNGTISHTNVYDYPANVMPANWFSPTTTGIGSSYQVRFTLQSGTPWDANALFQSGGLYALSSARTAVWSLDYAPSAGVSATVLVEILTSGGVLYASGTLTVNLYNGEA